MKMKKGYYSVEEKRKGLRKPSYITPLLKGLQYTFKMFMSKDVTIQYPEQRRKISDRWRGIHRLVIDGDRYKCVGCGLCAAVCPPKAIKIVTAETEEGERYPDKFIIDELRCIFCGYCVEVCPKDAIEYTKVYDFVGYDKKEFILNKEDLVNPEKYIFKAK
jgi:NADH-quinone oxidoreductase subunit I